MSWRIESILEAPTKRLDAWIVVEVPFDGPDVRWTRHVVDGMWRARRGGSASPVEVLDPERRLVRTRSGRVYELRHGPGLNGDAFSTWCPWKGKHKLEKERDTSDEVAALLA